VIADAMRERIAPLMPADPVRGRRWANHRRTVEAIASKYRTCGPWRDLPDELGSFQTAHKRLTREAVDGTWERILAALLAAADDTDDIGWTVPTVGGMMIGSTQTGTRLVTRVPARFLMGPGFLVAAAGMVMLARLEVGSSYASTVLPALVLLGLGMGTTFAPAMSLPTPGIEPRDAGIASAMINTSQQMGGAIGTAPLNTIAASATTSCVKDHIAGAGTKPQRQLVQLQGVVHGYANAIWFAVGMLAIATLIVLTLVNRRPSSEGVEVAVPVVTH
jgi:transposase